MKEQCLDEIQKNGNLPRNITQQIEGSMCTNDCSGHGNCVNGRMGVYASFPALLCTQMVMKILVDVNFFSIEALVKVALEKEQRRLGIKSIHFYRQQEIIGTSYPLNV